MWIQKEIRLTPKTRGFHLVTREIMPHIEEMKSIDTGLLHIFIKHTSAALTINEDADPSVRIDFEAHFNKMAPENAPYYRHTMEGPDDMPAHLKTSILGSSLTIPISRGNLVLGTWQGIYLCEFRNRGGSRKLVVTLFGKKK